VDRATAINAVNQELPKTRYSLEQQMLLHRSAPAWSRWM